MTKTSSDVYTQALRHIGVEPVQTGETPAEYAEHARTALDGLLAELLAAHDSTITWTVETVPDNLFLPVSRVVAYDIASAFGPAAMQRAGIRSRHIMAIRQVLHTNDITDSRDLDEDGTISTDEVEAGQRAEFY